MTRAHGLGAEDLAGVGRPAPRGQHRQAADVGVVLHRVDELHPAGEHVGEADGVVEAEGARHVGAAQVAVDEGDGLSGEGDGRRQVGRDRRLAVPLLGAGDDDGPRRVVDVHVGQVGPEPADRLGRLRGGAHPAGGDEQRAGVLAEVGHGADDGELGGALDVLRRAQPAVEQRAGDGVAGTEQRTEDRAEQHVALDLRGDRAGGQLGRLGDLDPHALPALGRLDVGDPLRERPDPGVGQLLRLLGRAGPGGDLDDHGLGRLGGVDVADQGLGGGVEAEVVDDDRGGLAVLGEHDVRRRARLGQDVVEVVEARVAAGAGRDEAGRAGGIDLRLEAAPPERERGSHDHHRRHGDPVVAQDAQVVGQFHQVVPV